jgi:hypothetical protein
MKMKKLKKLWNRVELLLSISRLKISITTTAVVLIIIHLIWPKIDSVTIGLLMLAVLPWLSSLIESVEVPGIGKIKLRNVQDADKKITGNTPIPMIRKPSYLAIEDRESNLALLGLRIEIEKRLRNLASHFGLPSNKPLILMLHELHLRKAITDNVKDGLTLLINAGNSAVHGAKAMDRGPAILAQIDKAAKLKTVLSKSQSIPPKEKTKIKFDKIIYDTHNDFWVEKHIWTASKSAIHDLNLNIQIDKITEETNLFVIIESSNETYSKKFTISPKSPMEEINTIKSLDIDAGDTVVVYIQHNYKENIVVLGKELTYLLIESIG